MANRVAEHAELTFAEAAELFSVSEMTIRRDVEALEAQGLVRRVPGGLISTRSLEPPIASRLMTQVAEKEHIAAAVVGLLGVGSRVMIDSGSTALAVAKAIRGRGLGLTVLTPSLLAAMELVDEEGATVIVTGGELRPGELSLIGPETVDTVSSYNIDTYVMGVAGVDPRGISDYNRSEAATKRAGVASCQRVIVCVDASKLDQSYLSNVAAMSDVQVLVTDGDPGNPTVQAAREAGVRVITVSQESDVSPSGPVERVV